MERVTIYIKDDNVEGFRKRLGNHEYLVLVTVNFTNPSRYEYIANIIIKSRVRKLAWLNEGRNEQDLYLASLCDIVICKQLDQLQYANYYCVFTQYDEQLYRAIAHSKIRQLSLRYEIEENAFNILNTSRYLTSFCPDKNSANLYHHKMLSITEANRQQIANISRITTRILSSKLYYRDIIKLIAKYVWNAHYM